jgi:hypothetical protein
MTILQTISTVGLAIGWLLLLSQIIRKKSVPERLTVLGLLFLLFGSAFPRYDPGGWLLTLGAVLACGSMIYAVVRGKGKAPTGINQ